MPYKSPFCKNIQKKRKLCHVGQHGAFLLCILLGVCGEQVRQNAMEKFDGQAKDLIAENRRLLLKNFFLKLDALIREEEEQKAK